MKKAILCVDDEKIIILSLLEQLRDRFGDEYIYETAMSGEEALGVIDELVCESVSVILIISDYLMRGMKGDELLIRVHNKYPGTIKIMLTGQATDEAVKRVKEEAGLGAYVTKPWIRERLMDRIEELLGQL